MLLTKSCIQGASKLFIFVHVNIFFCLTSYPFICYGDILPTFQCPCLKYSFILYFVSLLQVQNVNNIASVVCAQVRRAALMLFYKHNFNIKLKYAPNLCFQNHVPIPFENRCKYCHAVNLFWITDENAI